MKKYFLWMILIIVCLTPLLWFKGDLIIAHGDDAIFLNPGAFFKNILWGWDSFFYNCGGANNSMPLVFPLSFFWSLFNKFGIGLAVIERMWLVSVWLITGFAMFYLTQVLGLSLIASFFSSLLYLLNVFTAQQPLIYNFRLPYMTLPLLFAFTVKGLDLKNNMIRYAMLFSISTLLMASSWANPPWAVIAFIPVSFFILYRIVFLKGRNEGLRILFYCITSVLFTFLLNLWWLIPDFASFSSSAAGIRTMRINIFAGRGFYEIFRFLKSWAFGYSGYDYHNIYYNSKSVIFATYLLPILTFSSLLRKKKGFTNYSFFVFFAILTMFLAKGPLPPFGNIYNYLFYKVPGFVMFREPYTKFIPLVILSYSILFGDSINWICGIFKDKYRNFLYMATIFLVGYSVFPIFGKSIFWQKQGGWKQNKGERSAYVKIPEYWQEANRWVRENIREGRLFVLPRSTGIYNWSSGFNCGGTVANYLLNVSIVSCSGNSNNAVKFLNLIYNAFGKENLDLSNILKIFGISYMLHDKDVYSNSNWWRFYDLDYLPPNLMKRRLEKEEGITIIKDIGHLSFYKVKESYYLPKIYTADNLTFINGTLPDLVLEPLQEYCQGKPAFIINEQILLESLPENLQKRINTFVITDNDYKNRPGTNNRNIVNIYKRDSKPNKFIINLLDNGIYDISAKLKLLKYPFKQIVEEGRKVDIDIINMLSTGKCYENLASLCDYKKYFDKFKIAVLFDGDSKEDEYLQIKDFNPQGNDIDIDLTLYPYLKFCYRVEDPRVQILQLVLGIDINRDNKVDFWLRNIWEKPAPTQFSNLYYDACGEAQLMMRRLKYEIDRNNFYCHAIKIEIYPHKIWGVDCSQKPASYNYYLKELQFCNKLEYLERSVSKTYVFDKILLEKHKAKRLHSGNVIVYTNSIDIVKYNKIEFHWMGSVKDALVNVNFVLDLNGDGLADRTETVYTFNSSSENVSHLIDFENVINSKERVNLLAVVWESNGLQVKYLVNRLQRLKIYRTEPDNNKRKFSFMDCIFLLDNKKYNAKFNYVKNMLYDLEKYDGKYDNLRQKTKKNVIVRYQDVFLTTGRKVIRNLLYENDTFNIDWICLKKSKENVSASKHPPKIVWRKINPTRYLVNIKSVVEPFLLVFSESFHKNWKAYVLPKMQEINAHIPVNGYAQAWWIEGQSSDFQVSIEYLPQKWTNMGWGISAITLICSIIYLGLSVWKK